MKKLNTYVSEALVKTHVKRKIPEYHYFPKDRDELRNLVKQLIKERGNEADLNDIDVSQVTDMNELFSASIFNGDISLWDVSNVTDMSFMFYNSDFNGDISEWDVSNVTNMWSMFLNGKFNGDISSWDVSSVTNMECMFAYSLLQGKEPQWYKDFIEKYPDGEKK